VFDVTIIGAGVVGNAIARELCRYKLNICVVEKDSDVGNGTSKANSGIVHAGFDAEPNTLKSKLNLIGNSMFDNLSKELDFTFKKVGSLVLCFNKAEVKNLEKLKQQGIENGVPDLEIIGGDKVREVEPNISKNVVAALYAPTGGIVCPYEMTIALAENAAVNGVKFKLNTRVISLKKSKEFYIIETNRENIETKLIINAAGIESPGLTSSPAIAEMVRDIVVSKLKPEKNDKFNPIRKEIPKFREMTNEERKRMIASNPKYGKIIYRCETVTEGEILDAIRRPLGARTMDAVKKRTRSGMGRCQSGFCSPRVVEILTRELKISPQEVTKFGNHSNILVGKDKQSSWHQMEF
jgi:L-2-hydroxyglutarate oxidase LhgO